MIGLLTGEGPVVKNKNTYATGSPKENNVFKDGIGVKGLSIKLHDNNHGNHG